MEKKKLAKGKLFITTAKLKELFNIPQEVEFAKIELNIEHNIVEIMVLSAEPVEQVTLEVVDSLYDMRRFRLPRAVPEDGEQLQ